VRVVRSPICSVDEFLRRRVVTRVTVTRAVPVVRGSAVLAVDRRGINPETHRRSEEAVMTASAEAIASLKEDLALEHAAIVQYVINGVQLRDAAITDPVRRIAREEMWHFEWLTEAIRDRGGVQPMDRAQVFLSTSMADSMGQDVAAEDRALAHYARSLELIADEDPELTLLIERIMDDERHHRASFGRLHAEILAEGEAAYAPHAITGPADIAVAGPTIGTEYTSVLQYLWNKYGCGDCEMSEQYFEFAVEEMRHLGWAAAYVPGLADPVPPDVPVDRVRAVGTAGEARAAAESVETAAQAFYSAKVGEAASEALRDDLARALVQHDYHRHVIGKQA
jgi:bacterioferritin